MKSKAAVIVSVVLALMGLWIGLVRAEPGLLGEYYNVVSPPAAGTPGDFSRVDPTIDFSWPGDAPENTSIVPDDEYSERWTGYVRIDQPGNWTFTTTSNDGIRLWVDGQLIVSNWTQHTAKDDSGSLNIPAANWYAIKLEHFNDGGTAIARLKFGCRRRPVLGRA